MREEQRHQAGVDELPQVYRDAGAAERAEQLG